MELDARQQPEGKELAGDICIIGAGPSGLTLAAALVESGQSIVLLESGSWKSDERTDRLNDGPTHGWPYAGLGRTRHRQIGGTPHHWNTWFEGKKYARYAPLDPVDLERPGWPFGFDTLEPWYREAQRLCRLEPFGYEAHRALLNSGTPALTTRIYQYGPAEVFTLALPQQLREASNVILCHSATVCQLHAEASGRLARVEAKTLDGITLSVTAGTFVLAAGAVENARLLLSSLGNHSGWVGRCFMEHPRDRSITFRPSSETRKHLDFYELHRSLEGAIITGRLALRPEVLRQRSLPNASMTFLPTGGDGLLPRILQRVGLITRNRLSRSATVQVLINLEQLPHPDNRIVLSKELDELGVPRPELHWEWRTEEQEALHRLRTLIAGELGSIGSVQLDHSSHPDPNAHHHAGTTRMHADPAQGVVDSDGKVHGMANVFVTGSSILPSAGFANPALTIVALALRLADHLIRR